MLESLYSCQFWSLYSEFTSACQLFDPVPTRTFHGLSHSSEFGWQEKKAVLYHYEDVYNSDRNGSFLTRRQYPIYTGIPPVYMVDRSPIMYVLNANSELYSVSRKENKTYSAPVLLQTEVLYLRGLGDDDPEGLLYITRQGCIYLNRKLCSVSFPYGLRALYSDSSNHYTLIGMDGHVYSVTPTKIKLSSSYRAIWCDAGAYCTSDSVLAHGSERLALDSPPISITDTYHLCEVTTQSGREYTLRHEVSDDEDMMICL